VQVPLSTLEWLPGLPVAPAGASEGYSQVESLLTLGNVPTSMARSILAIDLMPCLVCPLDECRCCCGHLQILTSEMRNRSWSISGEALDGGAVRGLYTACHLTGIYAGVLR
jgi:hypothetical protein